MGSREMDAREHFAAAAAIVSGVLAVSVLVAGLDQIQSGIARWAVAAGIVLGLPGLVAILKHGDESNLLLAHGGLCVAAVTIGSLIDYLDRRSGAVALGSALTLSCLWSYFQGIIAVDRKIERAGQESIQKEREASDNLTRADEHLLYRCQVALFGDMPPPLVDLLIDDLQERLDVRTEA